MSAGRARRFCRPSPTCASSPPTSPRSAARRARARAAIDPRRAARAAARRGDRSASRPGRAPTQVVTARQPTAEEWEALRFAWRVMAHVKSNTVIFTDRHRTRAIGAGQMSRVDAVKVATMKAAGWDSAVHAPARRHGRGVRCVLSVPRRTRRGRRRRRDGRHSARRISARRGGDRGRRRTRPRDGVHGPEALQALSNRAIEFAERIRELVNWRIELRRIANRLAIASLDHWPLSYPAASSSAGVTVAGPNLPTTTAGRLVRELRGFGRRGARRPSPARGGDDRVAGAGDIRHFARGGGEVAFDAVARQPHAVLAARDEHAVARARARETSPPRARHPARCECAGAWRSRPRGDWASPASRRRRSRGAGSSGSTSTGMPCSCADGDRSRPSRAA